MNSFAFQHFKPIECTDLEALRIRQGRLRGNRLVLGAVDLKALYHVQLLLSGLGADFIGGSPRLFFLQLEGRHLTCLEYKRNVVEE